MLDNRVTLSGFNLESTEREKTNDLIERYIKRIEDRVKDYEELKITLKTKPHAKTFLHEVHGQLFVKGKRLAAKETNHNLYNALARVFERLLREIEQTVIKWKGHKARVPQKTKKRK